MLGRRVVTSLQVHWKRGVALRNTAGIGIVLFVKNDDFEADLYCGCVRFVCSKSYTTVQPIPARYLLAAGRLGRKREVVQSGEPGLGHAALRLNRECVPMTMPQIDKIFERLNGWVAAGERHE